LDEDAELNPHRLETSREMLAFKSFIIVRSRKDNDVLVRLQSDPILLGLYEFPGLKATLHIPDPKTILKTDQATCLIFHYHDADAVQAIRSMKRSSHELLVICLGSDIYRYSRYTELHDLVNLYIMPTEIHRKILSHGVYKPVYMLTEAIDPIALKIADEHRGIFPQKTSTRALWFGYSESFHKSMSSLVPIIMQNVNHKTLKDFFIIVDEQNFLSEHGTSVKFPTINYDNATFRIHAEKFDYAILSHFSLDLKLNSHIKSPNKAITALIAGLIPIASDTPNYRELFVQHGLEKFLFSSPQDLDTILNNLDPERDSKIIQESGILASLLTSGSTASLVSRFLDIVDDYCKNTNSRITQLPLKVYSETPRRTTFREHLSDIIPSGIRAYKSRLHRLRGYDRNKS
jgi:hypothetical protein